MKRKVLAMMMVAAMTMGLVACGGSDGGDAAATGDDTSSDTAATTEETTEASGDLIKVGIINNDPNESGYRTANDADLKAMFTKENGYDASFAYSLKNDEQIQAAQQFIQDDVDYLLLYKNNLKAGTGKLNVVGIGKYTGTQVVNFGIPQTALTTANIKLTIKFLI